MLDGESDILANAADPLTANVFDPSIRGHTSQFMLRFRKPALRALAGGRSGAV